MEQIYVLFCGRYSKITWRWAFKKKLCDSFTYRGHGNSTPKTAAKTCQPLQIAYFGRHKFFFRRGKYKRWPSPLQNHHIKAWKCWKLRSHCRPVCRQKQRRDTSYLANVQVVKSQDTLFWRCVLTTYYIESTQYSYLIWMWVVKCLEQAEPWFHCLS